MSNACIAVHTAASCSSQPENWRVPALSAGSGSCMIASPSRSPTSRRRTEPRLSICVLWRRAVTHANANSAKATKPTTIRLVTAQCGTFAVKSTQMTRVSAGKRSKIRCANTEPINLAVVPGRPGMRRRSTATRASSPTRPGSTTFPNRPTQNAANT